MRAAVKVFHHTVMTEAEHALVICRDAARRNKLNGDIAELVIRCGIKHWSVRPHRITFPGHDILFLDGAQPDNVCGLRASVVFTPFSEWTTKELDEQIKPLLTAAGSVARYRIEQRLIDGGHLAEAERYQSSRTIDDMLVDLDAYALPAHHHPTV